VRQPSSRIAGFDGLRALAFLAVFANHKLGIPQRDALGSVGVWSFFVLSGFLITRILACAREDVEVGRIPVVPALKRFYLRRTARIFPVYYAMLSFALILSLFVYVDDFWLKEKLAYIFYATNILIGLRDGWIGDFGHLWSLAVEEQYYLLFAPLVLFLPRRRTAFLCVGMVIVGLAIFCALHMAGTQLIVIYVNPLVNFGMLGFGGLVGLASLKPTSDAVPVWLTAGAAQAAVAACMIAAPLALGGWNVAWLTYGPAIVLLAGLLLFQIFNGQGTWFVSLLETAPLRLVGRVSYAAYLFHPFVHSL
jgi:peptidoglycan/LPS O-acetylase OafA/YrhL